MQQTNKIAFQTAFSAIMVALATALSMVKVVQMPLGGSVTLLSMLPVVMVSLMFGLKWGLGCSFVYALIQLLLGITMSGLLGWGLTPVMLTGTVVLDYLLAYTVLGLAGLFAKKGTVGACLGTAFVVLLRFCCHFLSGVVIFKELGQFELFGSVLVNRPVLYSLAYNGFYMLPEMVITLVGAAVFFRLSQVKRILR